MGLAFAPAWYRAQFADDIAADFDRLLEQSRPRRWWVVGRALVGLAAAGLYESLRTLVHGVSPAPRHATGLSCLATLDRLAQDVRHAIRSARRVPLVTSLAVLSIALGSGATTAIYSAVDAVFFRPLPFAEPERIVQLPGVAVPLDHSGYHRDGNGPTDTRPAVDLPTVGGMREVFRHAAAFASGALNLGSGEEPRRVNATFVTSEFFHLLGRGAYRGRFSMPTTSKTVTGTALPPRGHRHCGARCARRRSAGICWDRRTGRTNSIAFPRGRATGRRPSRLRGISRRHHGSALGHARH